MKRHTLITTALAAALLVFGVTPATALDQPIDIRAELDLPSQEREGPAVFLVEGVTAGDGPELTGADLVDNPSNWGGDIVVDVDPAAETITVSADDPWDFELVVIRITSAELDRVRLVATDFGQDDRDGAGTTVTELVIDRDDAGATFTWTPAEGTSYFYLSGTAVFSYGASTFVDVPSTHPFFEEIEWLAAEGLSTGTEIDGRLWFFPAGPMSRQAMAAFIFRYLGDPGWTPAADTQTFPDVPSSHPFYREIEWMAAEGLATGYSDGSYGPGNGVSRQAMAAFLHRLAGEPAAPAPSFSDTPADHPFAAAIGWLESAGIAQGYSDGTFGPGNGVSRQAMAAYLYRFDHVPV